MAAGWMTIANAARVLAALLFAAFNLLPLWGIRAWGWDAFQVLILFWSETVILAAWTMVRLALIPPDRLGTMTVNGQVVQATRGMTVRFFSLHAGAFIGVHLLFLCLLFSNGWFGRLHGVGDFFWTLYVASGAWLPLAFAALAGGVETLGGEFRPAFMAALLPRQEAGEPPPGDPVGRVIGALYGRIAIMQVAIIFGAWAAQSWGSMAPLVIVIAIKTLFDFGKAFAGSGGRPADWTASSGGISYTSKGERETQ